MRQTVPTNSLHNPFVNRFNDPVRRRYDEMQAYAYMAWLRERNQYLCQSQRNADTTIPSAIGPQKELSRSEKPKSGGVFAGAFALFFLLVSVAALLRVL